MAQKAAKKAAKKVDAHKKPVREAAIDAALSLSVSLGWAHVTLSDIAQEAGCSLAELYDHFDDKGDILAAYERGINRRLLAGAGGDLSADPRDALFDLLMDRFELLNEDREALLSILSTFKYDAREALLALPQLARSMGWMLEAAGIETGGWRGAARITGLTGVYLSALKTWKDDDSADMAKTMATLDKALARAESWAGRLSF